MKHPSFSEYLTLVAVRFNKELHWRMGQTYMNILHDIRPDLYAKITGEYYDPFYNDVHIPVFIQEVCKLWGKDV